MRTVTDLLHRELNIIISAIDDGRPAIFVVDDNHPEQYNGPFSTEEAAKAFIEGYGFAMDTLEANLTVADWLSTQTPED